MTPLDELLVKLRAYRSVNEWGDPVRHEILDQAADALEAAARENERLREALAFYADASGWNQPPVKTIHNELLGPAYENQASLIRRDRGKIARNVLSGGPHE